MQNSKMSKISYNPNFNLKLQITVIIGSMQSNTVSSEDVVC